MEEKINKENLRLVMRFLKTANLWLTWLEYVDSVDYIRHKQKGHHWSDWMEVGTVFGHCNFTSFLKYRGIILRNYWLSVADVFREYVRIVKRGDFENAFHYAKTAFIKTQNHLY